jgi:hypothetical protein
VLQTCFSHPSLKLFTSSFFFGSQPHHPWN